MTETSIDRPAHVEVQLCVADDQEEYLPRRRRAPGTLPRNVPVPGIGDVIYLNSTSAWVVKLVIHEWRTPQYVHIGVWLEHVNSPRHGAPPGFALTQ